MHFNLVRKKIMVFLISQLFIVCWLNSYACSEDVAEKKEKGIIAQEIEELSLNIQKVFKAHLKEKKKLRVAVIELENEGDIAKSKNMGKLISEMLTTELAQNENVELIEREQLNKILSELKLSQSDMIDPKSANRVGKILTANALLCGSVSDAGQFFVINIRLVDVEEARIIAASSVDIKIRKSDLFAEVDSWLTVDKKIVQHNLDAITVAIHNYATTNLQKNFRVAWPKSLEELVPEYLDRIPDPIEGSWEYNPQTGKVHNPAYPDMVPSVVFPKIQPVLDSTRRTLIKNMIWRIKMAVNMYAVEEGRGYPKRLSDLVPGYITKLPNPLEGEWIYNSKTGEVSHSVYKIND